MEIIFAGGSHHGVYGYLSLTKVFDKIYILEESKSVVGNKKRSCDEIIVDFDDSNCKYVVLCGYGKFITKSQLQRKQYINVHEALLPKYRGCHPIFWAILNGETEIGVSIHEVAEGMDDGDIIKQFSFGYNGEKVKVVKSKVDDIVHRNLGNVVAEYIRGEIVPVEQDEKDVSYGAQRSIDDCYVDFEADNRYLKNLFKALTDDYPLPRIIIRGESYEIIEQPDVESASDYGPVGRVVDKKDNITRIRTREGYIFVSTVRNCNDNKVYQLSDLIPIGYRFKYGKDRK